VKVKRDGRGVVRTSAPRGRRRRHHCTDVTARKRAEADSATSASSYAPVARSRAGTLSGACTRLKQPLTSIRGNAEAALSLLSKGKASPEELTEILNDIVQDDERAAQVIQRLRALMGKGDPQHAPVELDDLVRESLDLIHSEFVTRNVVANFHLDPALPAVLADRIQMQQVVLNLLMNACEATATSSTFFKRGSKPRSLPRTSAGSSCEHNDESFTDKPNEFFSPLSLPSHMVSAPDWPSAGRSPSHTMV
jgi:C4-dicarboxylate-specific signal transduction histidine kinase